MSWRDSASGSGTFHGGGSYSGNNGPSGAGTGRTNGGSSGRSSTGGLGGGLTTGKTWHGNTAYGASGGLASGYATMRDGGGMFGLGPSINTYGNFKNLDGSNKFKDPRVQGAEIKAKNANQAAGIAQDLANAFAARINGGVASPGTPTNVEPAAGPPPMLQPQPQPPPQKKPGFISAMLGGGGLVGFGLNPVSGGSWVPSATKYYGGYGGKPVTGRLPQDPSFGGNTYNQYTGQVGSVTPRMPSPTGEQHVVKKY
jgi:hypothetical protein